MWIDMDTVRTEGLHVTQSKPQTQSKSAIAVHQIYARYIREYIALACQGRGGAAR